MRLCCQIIALLNRLLWPPGDELTVRGALFHSDRHQSFCSAAKLLVFSFRRFPVIKNTSSPQGCCSKNKSLGFKSTEPGFTLLLSSFHTSLSQFLPKSPFNPAGCAKRADCKRTNQITFLEAPTCKEAHSEEIF